MCEKKIATNFVWINGITSHWLPDILSQWVLVFGNSSLCFFVTPFITTIWFKNGILNAFFSLLTLFLLLLWLFTVFAIFRSGNDLATHWTWTKINLDVNKPRNGAQKQYRSKHKTSMDYLWMSEQYCIDKRTLNDVRTTHIENWHSILANKKAHSIRVFVSSF